MQFCAGFFIRLDEQTLPSLYSAVGASFQSSPTQLGYLTLCRALVQALASPWGGIAGTPLPVQSGKAAPCDPLNKQPCWAHVIEHMMHAAMSQSGQRQK